MDGTVQVRITVRKYLWSEFVHDVCYVLYATIMITNALSKRYFHLSLRQIARGVRTAVQWIYWIALIGIWSFVLIAAALGGR
ncbi:MAG: hypothetical protein NT149_00505 [Candidatus Gottesmanbacteria bacterium]|nr:hypothetical protein [Candidatus Gottesmanbacteria bacterium]